MADTEPDGRAVVPSGGPGALRASHEDRDQVAERLRVAAGDGRLSPEELDARLELALTARTYAELAALVADLPAPGTAAAPATADAAPAKDVIRLHVTSGHAKREGQWVVPSRMDLSATSGHIRVDFTQALITKPTLHIHADVTSGHITLITKPGIVVDADDVFVTSGRVKVLAPWGPDAPARLRIDVAGSCGSGRIVARPPRRSFWQWLRRAPRPYAIAVGGS
ncbi:MAG TPA: DUF1707 domain-containing protein [Trebonia sp.]|nr:DUF1707 domain-containing protein [Trebonia sp.]